MPAEWDVLSQSSPWSDLVFIMDWVDLLIIRIRGSILFANHKANGVVTNIGLLANTVDDTGSYMAG